METFAAPKEFVDNPRFASQRERALRDLKTAMIDDPLRELVAGFAAMPYCYTLQSCYGHFVYDGRSDPHNVEPLPEGPHEGPVEYRIAYLALCIERGGEGRRLYDDLAAVAEIDPAYIQFGSPAWFWRRRVNAYALQVEPERYKDRDSIVVRMHEARRIERARNAFFARIGEIVERLLRG